MEIIKDSCRVCLISGGLMVNIYEAFQKKYRLVEIIEELLAEKLKQGECMLRTVCYGCGEKLVEYHLFRILVIQSQQKLLQKSAAQPIIHMNILPVGEADVHKECNQTDVSMHPHSDTEDRKLKYLEDIKMQEAIEKHDLKSVPQVEKNSNIIDCEGSDDMGVQSNLKQHRGNVHSSMEDQHLNSSNTKDDTIATTEEQLICDKCNRSFSKRSAFLKHYHYVHLKEQFQSKIKCPLCPRQFSGMGNSSNVHRHIRNMHKKNSRMRRGQIIIDLDNDDLQSADTECQSIQCTHCMEYFPNVIDLYEHSKMHDSLNNETVDGYNLECEDCSLALSSLNEYSQHVKDSHTERNDTRFRPIKCRWCGERFARIQGLYSHIRYSHDSYRSSIDGFKENQYGSTSTKHNSCLCTICGKFLSSVMALNTHQFIHTNEKNFKCNICSATFRQYNTLYIHKAIHFNERKYKCKQCDKTFRQNAHLKTHLKSHGIGIDKWYTCTICNKKFYSKGNLTVHMWVHKSGHPFQCSDCNRGFARKNQLMAHTAKKHSPK